MDRFCGHHLFPCPGPKAKRLILSDIFLSDNIPFIVLHVSLIIFFSLNPFKLLPIRRLFIVLFFFAAPLICYFSLRSRESQTEITSMSFRNIRIQHCLQYTQQPFEVNIFSLFDAFKRFSLLSWPIEKILFQTRRSPAFSESSPHSNNNK